MEAKSRQIRLQSIFIAAFWLSSCCAAWSIALRQRNGDFWPGAPVAIQLLLVPFFFFALFGSPVMAAGALFQRTRTAFFISIGGVAGLITAVLLTSLRSGPTEQVICAAIGMLIGGALMWMLTRQTPPAE